MRKQVSTGLVAIVMGMYAASSHATLISYNGFSSTAGLTLVGSAAPLTTANGTVLQLTKSLGNQTGAAYSTSGITLGSNATFSTTFQFSLSNPGGTYGPADGFTFLLAANTTGIGGLGGGLGYLGVPSSVAIEFDTFSNGASDGNSNNHVSINTNGVLTDTALSNVYGMSSCSTTQAGCLSNGDIWTATIGYNGTALNVVLSDPAMGTSFNAISNYAINIASYLGTNNAYVGFTASTGGGWESQSIVNWQFANTTQLSSNSSVPEPASVALFGLGIAVMGRRCRRKV